MKRKMDQLQYFFADRKVPRDLQTQLRTFFNNSKDLTRTEHYKKLIMAASPKLKQKLSVWTFRWISKVAYLRGTSSQFTVAVVEHIKDALFT